MKKIYTHPWLIIVVITIITVFFGLQLFRAELDNNNFRFVPPNDPALETSRWIDDNFGSSLFVLVGLERPYGTVFDKDFLSRLRAYSDAVMEISIVKNVTSLISSEYITADGDAIVVEKLVGDNFSGTADEIAELKRRLLSWEMYDRALFSDDFTATQMLIPLTITTDEAGSKKSGDMILQIRDMAIEMFSGSASVYVTGLPVISTTVNEAMNSDLKLLIPLVSLVVLTVLFFSFRGFTAVILPLLTVLVSVIWSVGAMPLFGIKLSILSTVLPVILVAVGSAYGIHVVTHYLNGRTSNLPMSRDEHTKLVISTIMNIRKPVFLAALTTFVGFGSFTFTSVAPIREFGWFSSFGVAAAFLVAITFIPAMLIIRGPKQIKVRKDAAGEHSGFSALLSNGLAGIAARRKTVIFLAIIAVGFSFYGLSRLIIDNVMVEYFRPDTGIYRSDDFIRRQFGGSKVLSVVAHADSTDIILRPDTLAAMDGLSTYLQRKVPNVGKVMGFTDLLKRLNQVFNADESPDGLRVNASASVSMNDDAFGFDDTGESDGFGFDEADTAADDDFGFGFGFDDGEESDGLLLAEPETSPADYSTDINGSEKIYTQSELLDLFDRAGNLYRGMNANDLVGELKRQVNYEGASYYEIPLDPGRYGKETPEELSQLIANYLVLLSGNISEYANDPLEPTAIKSTVQLRTLGMDDSYVIVREMEKYIAANFPSDVKVTIGGSTMVENSLNNLVVQSQITSMLFSIICVFVIIAVSNKSAIAGLIGITPLSISILLNFAVMGLAGIKLNLGTSMVAAVSVGVGIDYTIHCLEAYKREYRAANGTGDYLRKVFFSSGRAIIINAVSVGAGFAVLLLSSFTMLGDLGLLIAITMFSSALVSLTVLPVMLALLKPKFVIKRR